MAKRNKPIASTRRKPTLSHVDSSGNARMVDVSQKSPTWRTAIATATVRMLPGTQTLIMEGTGSKGDVLQVARLAGIQAAKQTASLIPLCHTILLSSVDIEFAFSGDERLHISVTTKAEHRTGVEMEALTAAAIAALTVYDMCKAVDRGMVIEAIELREKTGGRSGDYRRV
jgi:cyclic pyranopterin phosphate synthase